MTSLLDKLITASRDGWCSNLHAICTHYDAEEILGDLSPCALSSPEKTTIPRIVSIPSAPRNKGFCQDSVSDICENRHCSQKPKRSASTRRTSPFNGSLNREMEHWMSTSAYVSFRRTQKKRKNRSSSRHKRVPSMIYQKTKSQRSSRSSSHVPLTIVYSKK